jgi:Holliday junction DNA helicase RuvA
LVIGRLRGELAALSAERALIDVGGVGYEVHVPLSTTSRLESAGIGAVVELHIHTHLREDALLLYGFATEVERRVFERLLSVSGVGPKLARAVLSGLATDRLLQALAGGEVAVLATIPGVGKKTAERLVLELRDVMTTLLGESPAPSPGPKPLAADEDLVGALVNLGYKHPLAQRAVADARQELPAAGFGELLRASLQRLTRR